MLGFFVVALDAQVVNIALPDIRTSQGVRGSAKSWLM